MASSDMGGNMQVRKLALVAGTVLMVMLVVFVGFKTQLTYEQTKRVGRADVPQPTIVISGTGRIDAVPNIATVSVGLVTEGSDIARIQAENTTKMNRLIEAMKQLGVAEKDIQTTNYSIYPKYDYTDGRNILAGYTVNQNAAVKVRDLTKVGAIFAKAGEIGANQVSGPDFTIDDPTAAQAEAREKAIADAKVKAEALAATLGMRLGRVVGFSENTGGEPPMYYDRAAVGLGGGESMPKIEPGQLNIQSSVSIIYEIE